MNVTEYISSGILEQYVAGTVSPQEKQEVECMSHIYPEIKAELVSLQHAIEQMAIHEAVAPPTFLKDKILASLREESVDPSSKVETPKTNKLVVSSKAYQWKVAASILALVAIGSIFFAVQKNKQNKELLFASTKRNRQQQQTIFNLQQQVGLWSNANYKSVPLNGIPTKSPESHCTVLWNQSNQDVYIAVHKLPKPPDDKQYQLWAIADGKPVDLGLLNNEHLDSNLQAMKGIPNPQAFAITLEKKGGVENPTLSEMYVMGGVTP